jgi:Bor protein
MGWYRPAQSPLLPKCPNGAAKVETQLSFVNHVVSLLTLGIYTSMPVTVTCAATSKTAVSTPAPDIAAVQGAN